MLSKNTKDALNKTALLFSRTLQLEEWETWDQIMELLNEKAVLYAFENWQQNGRFFPKPKDILDLVEVYSQANPKEFKYCGTCDHGWIRVFEGRTAGGNVIDPKVGAVKRCNCVS